MAAAVWVIIDIVLHRAGHRDTTGGQILGDGR
jgi:hypothetical protein